ncbi:hypothetical protein Mgra_00005041 [Meloidogyne graminicola]|uniref:Major facilitator superfamily (MFS) profile domain-containing protein n=1 Tax=Meloidogyne graminicola TaxID=189291 RepID=A0A8S9ZQQ0_9BILA|nr:hypothetical protein Mgra_00005041 [Meloidogyne graminicola]
MGFKRSKGIYKIQPISINNSNNNNIKSIIIEDERKTNWQLIYLCGLFTFSASVQFTLFFTSLWPFMQILDESVTVGFFGTVIAMYSLSQIIASPILGFWSNRIEKLKPPLIICNILMFAGNFIYCFVELFPMEMTRYVLLISRFIAGIGWAQVGLLKSFASSASINKDRSRATAFITGGMALGSVLGPAFQILFTWISYPGYPICLNIFGLKNYCLNISMFTAPALAASVVNIILLFLQVCWFKESYVGILKRKTDQESENKPKLPPYDRLAVLACYAIRFTQFFIFTNIETIGIAYAMMMFTWSATEVVYWESIAHSIRGLLALSTYIVYIVFDLGKRVNDRLVCLFSLIGLFLFHIFTYSWPFLSDNVQLYDNKEVQRNASSALGCDYREMNWCLNLKQINLWIYYFSIIIFIGLSFPNINITMNTLFSHIIGPRMQATQQGILEMFGGMGRMFGPLVIGFLYRTYGPRTIWVMESIEVGIMIIFWILCYQRLVPLNIPKEFDEENIREKEKI